MKQEQNNTIRNVLVLIALAVVAYAGYFQFIENPVSQSFVTWEQSDSEITTAKLNKPVTLKLDMFSNSLFGYSGAVKIQVRKDVRIGTDEVVASKTIMLDIPMGQKKKQSVFMNFTPNENAGGELDRVREYYYKIYLGGKVIYDPTEPGERNGLQVASKPSGGTVPTVTGILFNDQPQITVPAGTSITTKVAMSGKGSGTLKVEIRKDTKLLPDGEDYTVLIKNVNINGSTSIEFPTWKANDQGLLFRQYFARVSWNDDVVYDPSNPSEREYVKISGSGNSESSGATGSVFLNGVQWNIKPSAYSTAKLTFKVDGTYDGVVTVDIRQDVSLLSDKNLVSKQVTITGTDTTITADVGFTAPSSGNWVFVRVTPDVYDSSDPAARKAAGTEVQVQTSSSGSTGSTGGSTGTQPTQNAVVSYNIVELKSAFANGMRINVPQGTQVDVYATVSSNMATSGTLSVEVRRDMSWASDTTLTTPSKQVSLQAGTNTILVGTFTASDLSGANGFSQYFFKPSWNGVVLNDPTNPSTREIVTTYATSSGNTGGSTGSNTGGNTGTQPAQGTAQVIELGFSTGNTPTTTLAVNKYQNVNVYARIKAYNGAVTGQIKVEVKKDIIGGDDKVYQTLAQGFSLNNEDKWVLVGTFSPDVSTTSSSWAVSGVRQYFAKADLNADGSWEIDPQDPNTRPRVTVS